MPGLIASLLLGFGTSLAFASLLYWLDRYEKEPLALLGGVFLWGAVVAAGAAFWLNTQFDLGIYLFSGSDFAARLATGSLLAPLIEELLKGGAVLGVFLAFRSEFDSVLDGIIYAGVAALGFAATENAYYIYTYGFAQGGWGGLLLIAFIRILLVGWQHPFYTAFTGIGLALARLNRSWLVKVAAPLTGLSLAVFTHAFHNTVAGLLLGMGGMVVGAAFDWSGWLFMLGVIIWATGQERRMLQRQLEEEVQAGLCSTAQYATACSSWKQTVARLAALLRGRYRATARFYQTCGDLAHKKEQLSRLGEEGGNSAVIQRLRRDLAALAPSAQA